MGKSDKKIVTVFLTMLIMFFSLLLVLILVASGKVTLFLKGFAVDSAERLYIGKEYWVEVYEQGVLIDRIGPQRSRDYSFTIEDDTLLLADGNDIYSMDLQGAELDVQPDHGSRGLISFRQGMEEFTDHNGHHYSINRVLGYYWITRSDNAVVYTMPLLDAVALSLVWISLGIFFSLLICIPKSRVYRELFPDAGKHRTLNRIK